MAKTMVANVTGARLREAERQLALLRGEEAVNSFLESHPTETKVLQQLVEWRRAGRPVPALARVQRAMLWSDGSVELSAAPAPEPAARAMGGPRRDGGRPGDRRGRPQGGTPGSGGPRPPRAAAQSEQQGAARPPAARPFGGSRPAGGARPRGTGAPFGRPPGSRPGSFGGGAGSGGRRPGFQGRGGPGDGRRGRGMEEGGMRDVPRAGEGWVLLREGDAPPPGPTLGGLSPEETAAAEAAPPDHVAGTPEAAGPQETPAENTANVA